MVLIPLPLGVQGRAWLCPREVSPRAYTRDMIQHPEPVPLLRTHAGFPIEVLPRACIQARAVLHSTSELGYLPCSGTLRTLRADAGLIPTRNTYDEYLSIYLGYPQDLWSKRWGYGVRGRVSQHYYRARD